MFLIKNLKKNIFDVFAAKITNFVTILVRKPAKMMIFLGLELLEIILNFQKYSH